MKKIAYIELDTHAEVALHYYQSMKDSKEYQVDYYFSEKIFHQLNFSTAESVFLTNEKQLLHQLKEKEYDFVLIGTVHRYFSTFYQIARCFKMGFIVHNLNFTRLGKWQLFKNVFKGDVLYRLKLLFKESLLLLPQLRKITARKFVLDAALVDQEFEFLPIFHQRKIHHRISKEKDILKVVISGTVSQQRRDYKRVFKELQNVTRKMQIVFLGKVEGEELLWLQDFEKKKPKNLQVIYFRQKVSQEVFDHYMSDADVLWCPLQEKTIFFGQEEIYGKTKMSGNIGDAIKYNKPIIFPKGFEKTYSFVFLENDVLIDQLIYQISLTR